MRCFGCSSRRGLERGVATKQTYENASHRSFCKPERFEPRTNRPKRSRITSVKPSATHLKWTQKRRLVCRDCLPSVSNISRRGLESLNPRCREVIWGGSPSSTVWDMEALLVPASIEPRTHNRNDTDLSYRTQPKAADDWNWNYLLSVYRVYIEIRPSRCALE